MNYGHFTAGPRPSPVCLNHIHSLQAAPQEHWESQNLFARATGSAPFMTLSTSFVAGLSTACFFTFLPGRLPPLWLCQYHFRVQQYKLLITPANTYIVLTVYKALFEVLYSSAEFILTPLVLVQLAYEAGDIIIPICNGKTVTERLINLTEVKF